FWCSPYRTLSLVEIVVERVSMNGLERTAYQRTGFAASRTIGESDALWDEPNQSEDALRVSTTEAHEDSVQMYLREIGQVSLLSADDEVALAKDIVAANEAQLALQAPQLPWADRVRYERLVMRGEDARRR